MKRASRQKPPATLSSHDRELFRDAIGPVREFDHGSDLLRETRVPVAPEARQSEADERHVLQELLSQDEAISGAASGEVLSHLQDGYSPKLLKQLRRGQFVIEAELDLHHLRLHQARQILTEFLIECRRQRRRCICIIHGKGQRSADGSVIKAMTDRVLRQRAEVIGFTSARVQDGGTGAVVVLLKAA